jgi:hypothetical protein
MFDQIIALGGIVATFSGAALSLARIAGGF